MILVALQLKQSILRQADPDVGRLKTMQGFGSHGLPNCPMKNERTPMTSIAKQYAVREDLIHETLSIWKRLAPNKMLDDLSCCSDGAILALEDWLIKTLQLVAQEKAARSD